MLLKKIVLKKKNCSHFKEELEDEGKTVSPLEEISIRSK